VYPVSAVNRLINADAVQILLHFVGAYQFQEVAIKTIAFVIVNRENNLTADEQRSARAACTDAFVQTLNAVHAPSSKIVEAINTLYQFSELQPDEIMQLLVLC
jgi:hypothetical protein